MIWAHKADDPRNYVGDVVSATETEEGLEVTGRLDLGTEHGAAAYRNIKGRRVSGLSIGYLIRNSTKSAAGNELTDLELVEVSIVARGFALWAWCQVQMDRSALPSDRLIVALIFPDERPSNRRYWLLIDGGDAELCYSDPGGQPDLVVEAGSRAFVDWHRGARSWRDAIRSGDIKLTGPAWLRRSFPNWNAHRLV